MTKHCSKCKNEITQGVLNYSKKFYGKVLCIDCQKLEKKRVKKAESNMILLKLSEGWISDEK